MGSIARDSPHRSRPMNELCDASSTLSINSRTGWHANAISSAHNSLKPTGVCSSPSYASTLSTTAISSATFGGSSTTRTSSATSKTSIRPTASPTPSPSTTSSGITTSPTTTSIRPVSSHLVPTKISPPPTAANSCDNKQAVEKGRPLHKPCPIVSFQWGADYY